MNEFVKITITKKLKFYSCFSENFRNASWFDEIWVGVGNNFNKFYKFW